MFYSFLVTIILYFQLNVVCVEITRSPDTYLQGRIMVIPVQDDTTSGISLSMWYDYVNDTLYPYKKPCLQCILIGVTPVQCHE